MREGKDKETGSNVKDEIQEEIDKAKAEDPIFAAVCNFIKPEYLIKKINKD